MHAHLQLTPSRPWPHCLGDAESNMPQLACCGRTYGGPCYNCSRRTRVEHALRDKFLQVYTRCEYCGCTEHFPLPGDALWCKEPLTTCQWNPHRWWACIRPKVLWAKLEGRDLPTTYFAAQTPCTPQYPCTPSFS